MSFGQTSRCCGSVPEIEKLAVAGTEPFQLTYQWISQQN